MASGVLGELQRRLKEVDEVIAARDAICKAGAGRPAQQRGAAVLRAGVVLLSALFEAYVEDLYDLSVDTLYATRSERERRELKNSTSGKNNNAGLHQVNALFFHVGIPWIMSHPKCHWRKSPNAQVQERVKALAKARNEIAHGETRTIRKGQLVAWRGLIERLTVRLDEIAADRVLDVTGSRPW